MAGDLMPICPQCLDQADLTEIGLCESCTLLAEQAHEHQ